MSDNIDAEKEEINEIKKYFKKAQTTLYSLKDIFSVNPFFIIPAYQRGYVWETKTEFDDKKLADKQLDKFWKDIERNIGVDDAHYTGQIILQKLTDKELINNNIDEKTENGFFIVDGQQRLTTSLILLSVLIDNLKDEKYRDDLKDAYIFSGETSRLVNNIYNQSGTECLESILGSNNAIDKNKYGDNFYYKKLSEAKKFFNNKVKCFCEDENKIKEIIKVLLEKLKFNVLFVSGSDNNQLDSESIFDCINNRGKLLTRLEILKNKVFYFYKKANIDNKSLIKSWNDIYLNLGVAALYDNRVHDDDFLISHWLMYKGSVEKTKIEYIFDAEILSVVEGEINDKKKKEIKDYINSIKESSAYWKYLYMPHKQNVINSDEIKKYIDRICILSDKYIRALMLSLLDKYYKNLLKEDDFINVLRFLEKYLFCTKLIAGKKDFSFASVCSHNIYVSEKSEKVLEKIGEMIKRFSKGDNGDDRTKTLEGVLKQEVLHNWIEKYMNKNNAFYDWQGLKYMLYCLNSDLENQKISSYMYFIKKREDTIEHIFPQKPFGKKLLEFDKQYWAYAISGAELNDNNFDYEKGAFKNEKSYNLIKNSLGNFLPLTKEGNSSVGDRMYPEKRNNDKKQGAYWNASAFARSETKNLKHWTINSIIEKTLKRLEDIEKKWLSFEDIKFTNNLTIEVNKLTFDEDAKSKILNFSNEEDLLKVKRTYDINESLLDNIYNKSKE